MNRPEFSFEKNAENIAYSRRLSVKGRYDVIVAGGGVAGVSAALSAARRGARVLLLEKSNILGGLATLGLINLFVPLCNGRGKQIIFGLCEELLRESTLYGFNTIRAEWKNGEPTEPTTSRYSNWFSPYIFALQLTEKLKKEGIDLLFDTIATDPVLDGNSCRGVLVYGKGGVDYYECKVLIDTTGDADLLRAADIPTLSRGNFFTYNGRLVTLNTCREALETGNIKKAFGKIRGGGINLFGDDQPDDVPMWKGLDSEDVSDYLITNQLKMLEAIKEKAQKGIDYEIASLPHMPQLRTTACIHGDYTLRVEDAYRHFDDSVCAINDFEHRDHLWEVPLRTLCRKDTPNILTAGRSASGEGYGWDVLRVIPPAILTGQAVGEVAVLAIEKSTRVSDVPIDILQSRLTAANVMVHFPDEYVPEDRTVIIHGKNAVTEEGHI